jgi:hypothetical protein
MNLHYARRYTIDKAIEFAKQNGKCKFCHRPFEQTIVRRAYGPPHVVDHDHKTKKFRGFVCRSCNAKIGHFETTTMTLNQYDKKHSAFLDRYFEYIDE